MEKLKKNKRGITLVALVVTIVILLILAGVSINLVLGNNGIIKKAGYARDKYSNASANEQEQLSTAEDDIEKMLGTYDPLKKVTEIDKEEAKSKDMLSGTEKTKVILTDGTVVIPAGYKITGDSADTVAYGVVITDAETNGNEWVWVPVSASELAGMYETASPAIELTGGIGKTYISGVSTSKYSKSGIISGITRVLPNDTSSYREPDVMVGSGTSWDAETTNRATAGFTKKVGEVTSTMTLAEMAQTMIDEYSQMIESIKTNGGFYIGRYELTANGEKPGATLTSSSWYTLYAKCKELAKEGSNVTTRMIWGCQWDVTCNWIANNGEQKNITNSSTWGNYSDYNTANNYLEGDTGYESGAGSKQNTGSSENWKANNVYDLAGNCWEWTQEAYSTAIRVARGGKFENNGSRCPVSYRDHYGLATNPSYVRFSFYTLCKVNLSPAQRETKTRQVIKPIAMAMNYRCDTSTEKKIINSRVGRSLFAHSDEGAILLQ